MRWFAGTGSVVFFVFLQLSVCSPAVAACPALGNAYIVDDPGGHEVMPGTCAGGSPGCTLRTAFLDLLNCTDTGVYSVEIDVDTIHADAEWMLSYQHVIESNPSNGVLVIVRPRAPRTHARIEADPALNARLLRHLRGTLAFRDLTISGFNVTHLTMGAEFGGAALIEDGLFICERCVVENNSADGGGAFFLYSTGSPSDTGDLVLIDSVLRNNEARTGRGGAVYTSNGVLYAIRSSFEGNTAVNGEGGAFAQQGTGFPSVNPTFEIHNSLFMNNRAAAGSAVYATTTNSTRIVFSTFYGNTVQPLGPTGPTSGAVRTNTFENIVANSVFADNVTARSGGDVASDCEAGSNLNIHGTTLMEAAGCSPQTASGTLLQAEQPFQPYDAATGRLGLFPGPAVDAATGAGTKFACDTILDADDPTYDWQISQARYIPLFAPDRLRAPRPSGSGCDLGAFEYQGTDLWTRITGPATAEVGTTATITVIVTELTGAEPAHTGTIDITPSTGARILSVSGAACSEAGGVFSCALPSLAKSSSLTLSVETQLMAAGEQRLDVNLPGYVDNSTANNAASHVLSVSSPSFVCDHIVDTISGIAGEEYRFRLRLRNDTTFAAGATRVSIPWPSELSLVSADPRCALAASTLTCTGGPLAVGASDTFAVTALQAAVGQPAVRQDCSITWDDGTTVTTRASFGIEGIDAPAEPAPSEGGGSGSGGDAGEDDDPLGEVDLTGKQGRGGGGFRCAHAEPSLLGYLLCALGLMLIRRRARRAR